MTTKSYAMEVRSNPHVYANLNLLLMKFVFILYLIKILLEIEEAVLNYYNLYEIYF